MRNWSGFLGMQRVLMAEALGLEMARKAAEILERHQAMLTEDAVSRAAEGATDIEASGGEAAHDEAAGGEAAGGEAAGGEAADVEAAGGEAAGFGAAGSAEFMTDDAIFTSVLDAANVCLGRFDSRPAEERWCDALVQLLALAESAPSQGESAPSQADCG